MKVLGFLGLVFGAVAMCGCSGQARLFDGKTFDGWEGVAVLAMHWLENCARPGWCEGSDINEDGVVDFRDFVLVEGCCVETGGD